MVKHAHHNVDVDKPGKDSYELRKAGAEQMLLASHERWALMVEKPVSSEPDLNEMIAQLNQQQLDLILVEGFRDEAFAKIEIHRPVLGKALRFPNDPLIIAIATDDDLPIATNLPVLDVNNPQTVCKFIIEFTSNCNAPKQN